MSTGFSLSVENEPAAMLDGTAAHVSRDQILRRERGQGKMNHFSSVQMATSGIGSLTRLIYTLVLYVICDDHITTDDADTRRVVG